MEENTKQELANAYVEGVYELSAHLHDIMEKYEIDNNTLKEALKSIKITSFDTEDFQGDSIDRWEQKKQLFESYGYQIKSSLEKRLFDIEARQKGKSKWAIIDFLKETCSFLFYAITVICALGIIAKAIDRLF